jgi:hypothetical protein
VVRIWTCPLFLDQRRQPPSDQRRQPIRRSGFPPDADTFGASRPRLGLLSRQVCGFPPCNPMDHWCGSAVLGLNIIERDCPPCLISPWGLKGCTPAAGVAWQRPCHMGGLRDRRTNAGNIKQRACAGSGGNVVNRGFYVRTTVRRPDMDRVPPLGPLKHRLPHELILTGKVLRINSAKPSQP